VMPGPGGQAQAQTLAQMSCGELWYERNAIYARNGYCFKSDRALRTFGPRCHPPYGRLGRRDRRRVDLIMRWERSRDCRRGAGPRFRPVPPASPYAAMNCRQLWYERNAIFAAKGHCFKTRRGIRAFGRGCYPPYGRLNRRERRRVETIRRWERDNGCR